MVTTEFSCTSASAANIWSVPVALLFHPIWFKQWFNSVWLIAASSQHFSPELNRNRDDLQARSEAEGKHNVNYRCDLEVHWSLWSGRLLLMDHPTFAISLHPLLFLISHLSLSTNAGHRSSRSEMIFFAATSERVLTTASFPMFYEGARVQSVLSLSICLCRLIRQGRQQRLKEQPRISHMSLLQRDPPSYSSNSGISGLSRHVCTYISVTENKDQTNMWARVITRQSIQEIKAKLNSPHFLM